VFIQAFEFIEHASPGMNLALTFCLVIGNAITTWPSGHYSYVCSNNISSI